MAILAIVFAVGAFVCWILTLIKMFQKENVLLGILGILCSLWAFIWGWMNAGKVGHQKIMLIWTACIILYMIFAGLSGGFSYSVGTPTP